MQLAATENRLSREEALRLYMVGSASFSGEEAVKGSDPFLAVAPPPLPAVAPAGSPVAHFGGYQARLAQR